MLATFLYFVVYGGVYPITQSRVDTPLASALLGESLSL